MKKAEALGNGRQKAETVQRKERIAVLSATDRGYWDAGDRFAGIDEAGRGPLAGPVAAGCAVMPPEPLLEWVDDSKKLSARRRELVYRQIMDTALYAAVGTATNAEIDRMGIVEATKLAMRRAAGACGAEIFLVDALRGVGLPGEEIAIIHGDSLSYSIAAASILAKVERDREMQRMDLEHPGYGFARNKGYGTAEHIDRLRRLGPCPIHRMTFIRHLLRAP